MIGVSYNEAVFDGLINEGISEVEIKRMLEKYYPILLLVYKKEDHENLIQTLTKIHFKKWEPERIFSYIGSRTNIPKEKLTRYSNYLDNLIKGRLLPFKVQCTSCHKILTMPVQPKEAVYCNCKRIGIGNDFGNISLFFPYGDPNAFIEFEEELFL